MDRAACATVDLVVSWSAVVLAGGRGSRLGGVDKAAVVVGGRTLLDRVLDAVAAARQVVVVGPGKDVPGVTWAREDPPGGGPVAGLAAGLAHVGTDLVVLLAVDQPGITGSTVDRLLAAVGDTGAVLVDDDGRAQWLTGAWRVDRLRNALPADPRDASVRSVLGPLDPARVAARPAETCDVDSPHDLADPDDVLRWAMALADPEARTTYVSTAHVDRSTGVVEVTLNREDPAFAARLVDLSGGRVTVLPETTVVEIMERDLLVRPDFPEARRTAEKDD